MRLNLASRYCMNPAFTLRWCGVWRTYKSEWPCFRSTRPCTRCYNSSSIIAPCPSTPARPRQAHTQGYPYRLPPSRQRTRCYHRACLVEGTKPSQAAIKLEAFATWCETSIYSTPMETVRSPTTNQWSLYSSLRLWLAFVQEYNIVHLRYKLIGVSHRSR